MNTEATPAPAAMRIWGWCVAPGVWFLAIRLWWEATVLTARSGPQMIGFTFMHMSPLALPVMLSAFLAQVWLLIMVVWIAYSLLRRRVPVKTTWLEFVVIAVPVGILYFIPAVT